MILTDMKQLLRDTIYHARITHAQLGEQIGIERASVTSLIARQTPKQLTPQTVKLAEVLGFDIEVKFVKRKK